MIYKNEANFPYPVLTNKSDSYETSEFILDIGLQENVHNYRFDIDYTMDSEFINKLLESKKAQLILVIQSKDNKFFNIDINDKYIEIAKSRISLSKKTTIQLLIQAKEDINFSDNDDLNEFYKEFKNEINVSKNSILGFSNPVIFQGSSSKPFDLFKKRVDPNIKSDIKIELGNETITIVYKNEDFQFIDSHVSSSLNNTYVYMGLQKALYRFIVNNGDDGEVDLDEISPDDNNMLDFKLYNLMKAKMITDINFDNIDEVIYAISDKILEKFCVAVRGMYSNGN